MTPGELDQLITIQRETEVSDGMGGHTVSLSAVVSDLWAKVRPLSGKEAEQHGKLSATAMVAFIIRHRTDLLGDDRIVWNGDSYNIRHIQPTSQRSMYLIIEAEKGVAL